MTANGWLQIVVFFSAVLALTPPTGRYLHAVLEGRDHLLRRPLGWLERLVYRLGGVDGHEQRWGAYTISLLAFSAVTLLVTYALERLQGVLPLNPQRFGAVEPALAFEDAMEVHAERLRHRQNQPEEDEDLQPAVAGHQNLSGFNSANTR